MFDYSMKAGECRLPDGSKAPSWYTVRANGYRTEWNYDYGVLMTLDRCKNLCKEGEYKNKCTAFHHVNGKCYFQSRVVEGNGGTTTDCYVKNSNLYKTYCKWGDYGRTPAVIEKLSPDKS